MNNSREIAQASFKALIDTIGSCIPVFGFTKSVYENLSQIQAERKQQRLYDFVSGLSASVSLLEARLNKDYVSNEDFIDVFEKTARNIANERCEEKRKYFKNILLNSMINPHCDYDKTERFFRILDSIGLDEINILAILINPEKYNKDHGMIIKAPFHSQYQTTFVNVTGGGILTTLLNKKDYDVRECLNFLYYNGLVENNIMDKGLHTNGNPISVLNNSLTIKGKEFIRYILEE